MKNYRFLLNFYRINAVECTSKDHIHNIQKKDKDCLQFLQHLKIEQYLDVLNFEEPYILLELDLQNMLDLTVELFLYLAFGLFYKHMAH